MWIDTDTASDDAVAMLMAFKNPNVEVVGVSVVAGNVPLEQATQIALYTAEICGAKVPIHAGANRALVRTFVTAQNVHGSDGMGDIGLPLHGRTPTSTNGVQVMIEAFRAAPGSMDLVTLGPLTNVALAVRAEPKFASWVRRCVMMGGRFQTNSPRRSAHLVRSASSALRRSVSCASSAARRPSSTASIFLIRSPWRSPSSPTW